MMIQKLFKRFAGWVTKWNLNDKLDEFFAARLGLTIYYLITAVILLGGSSIITYEAILSNFTQYVLSRGFDPYISQTIIADARDILIDRFVTIDSIIILFTVIIGFLLTVRTLKPIKQNMERQKRFIADAAHELRTPTAVVISGLEVALSNKKLDFASAKKTLESTLEEMKEFSKLSNDLLDVSKYYKNKVDVKHELFDIGKLAKSIVSNSKDLALSKEINFEVKMAPLPAAIRGNEIELTRVFYNILDNAIKYTPTGGTIFIEDKIVSNKYVLTVKDTGVGIPKNMLNRVFDAFFRGNAARNTSGAGLGLTLARRIIENHQGAISLKSEENKGTSVIISLPISS